MWKKVELTPKQGYMSIILLLIGIAIMGVVAGLVLQGYPLKINIVLIATSVVFFVSGYTLAFVILLRGKSRELITKPYDEVITSFTDTLEGATNTLGLHTETLEKAIGWPPWLVSNTKLRNIERKARSIVVITPDLEHDVGPFKDVVLQNLVAGKKYRYIILKNPTSEDNWGKFRLDINKLGITVGRSKSVDHIFLEEKEQKLSIFEMVLYDPYNDDSRCGFWALPRGQFTENVKMDESHFSKIRREISDLWRRRTKEDLTKSLA